MTFEEYIEEISKDEKNKEYVEVLKNFKQEKETENNKLKNEVEVLKNFFGSVKTVETEEEKKKKEQENEKEKFNEMLRNW